MATLEVTSGRVVTAPELKQWRAGGQGHRLLDVRTSAEFEAAHIPGAVNIPLPQLKDVCVSLRDGIDSPLVVVCQAGPRARAAHELLEGHGCTQATVLDGGMNAWQGAGGEVEQGEPKWALERQVRFVAGSLVAGGIVASVFWPKARFFSGAIGGGLLFAALTDSCMMGNLLARLPYNQGSRVEVERAVAELTRR